MKKIEKILLQGYYGAGNLGDDLLMISAMEILQSVFPHANFYVKAKSYYVLGMVPGVSLYKNDFQPDLVVLGGGGLFFDFKKASIKYWVANKLVDIIGLKSLEKWIKTFKPDWNKEPLYSIIALGIGIGPYTSSSRNFIGDLVQLSHYKWLSVRDQMSYSILKKAGISGQLYSDLVFNDQAFPFMEKLRSTEILLYQIGVILRDWKFDDNSPENYIEMAEKLPPQYQINFFSFNPENDKKTISYLQNRNIDVVTYYPDQMISFLEKMSKQNLVITQRAHGAIVANLLNVPSVCIGIEPKLKNIHHLLPHSTLYLDKNFETDQLISLVKNEHLIDELRSQTAGDRQNNTRKINKLKQDLQRFFRT